MATKNIKEEENLVVGIDTETNPVKAEDDFVAGLLEAAGYKEEENYKEEIEIKRHGKVLFSFTVRPISTDEFYEARKKGTKYVKNPVNKKLPLVESEKDFNTALFHSYLIYIATVDEDRAKVWNNPVIKQKYNLELPTDSVPVLLTMGEMNLVVDKIMDISGLGSDEEEEDTLFDSVKN